MKFCIAPELLASQPDYLVGVVVARLVDNRRSEGPVTELLRQAEAMVRLQPVDAANGTAWRTAFAQFGIDVQQHPPAVDRLLERVQAGQVLPSVNPAVDLANAIALRHHVSLGVHDLDAVRGDITVRFARDGDTFLPFGSEESETVPVREPVYADERDVRTRWWISRQSRHGRAEARSSTLFFPIDGFAGPTEPQVRAAVDDLAALLRKYLGAVTLTALVDARQPCCTLRRFSLISNVPPDGDAIDELLGRGVVDVIKREELEPRLRSGERLKVKLGMDPTGPRLHVGRATRLFKLRQFQDLGHTVQFVVGSFTGMLGDPSDKTAYRQQLTPVQVHANMQTYVEQAAKIIDIHEAEVHYNADWLAPMTFADVIELASSFTVQQMIERENFHDRYVSGKPIYLHEFLYPLLQGQDSVVLRSDVEIGGTDQLFNMLAGRVLQERAGQRPQAVMTGPLIPGTNGEKMSTSVGNVVNVLDPPREQYFALMRMHDELIPTYFETCTTVPLSEIRDLVEELESGRLNPREAKAHLARTIVSQFHGAEAAQTAEREFEREVRQHERPLEIPEFTITRQPRRLADLIVELHLAPSKGAARRLVEQGGVEVGGERLRQPNADVTPMDGMILRVGKAGWARLKVAG
ncbi:MAG TPA: tyrosine--tRNA ligase [Chloroflexota bacterium]